MHLRRQNTEEAVSYWRGRLTSIDSMAFPLTPIPSNYQAISKSITERHIPLLMGRNHTLPSTLARAAWVLPISHYTANIDVVFGTILAGRVSGAIANIKGVIGPTIITVPVRHYIDSSMDVSTFLEEIQKDAVEATLFASLGLQQISRISPDARQEQSRVLIRYGLQRKTWTYSGKLLISTSMQIFIATWSNSISRNSFSYKELLNWSNL